MDLETQKQIQKHFERMHQASSKPWREIGQEPALDDFFRLLKEKHPAGALVLDLGCGDGWIAIRAAREGHQARGIDSSETAIREAGRSSRAAGIADRTEFLVGDALALPYENRMFDAVIDRGLFHHILPENRPVYFENILRVLRPKSLMYLSVFTTKNPAGIGQLFTKELIHQLFGNYFRFLSFRENPHPSASPAHLMHFILERAAHPQG